MSEYYEKLEKLVDDQENLIIAQNKAIKLLMDFCHDRNHNINQVVNFFFTYHTLLNTLNKSFKFINDNDLVTKEKFLAVPWDALFKLAKEIPEESEITKIKKSGDEINKSYTAFIELTKKLSEIEERLSGEVKVLLDKTKKT